MQSVLDAVRTERDRQDKKWGANQHHPDVHPEATDAYDAAMFSGIPLADRAKENCNDDVLTKTTNWSTILVEEVAESVEAAANKDLPNLEKELVQVAAVCVAWIQDIRSRNDGVR